MPSLIHHHPPGKNGERQSTISDTEALKRAAAERAAEWIRDGMTLGLGTGSTVRHLLDVIAERRAAGEWRGVVGVPTSEDTAERSRRLGIPLATLDERPRVDLTIDGADEVDPQLNLIKGLGGALLWEKIVATASRRLVILADGSKLVPRLGTKAPLPIEVVPFGWRSHLEFIRTLHGEPTLRTAGDGKPYVTDEGNYILDSRFEGIANPAALERALLTSAGIVGTGLFLGMVEQVIIGTATGVEIRRSTGR